MNEGETFEYCDLVGMWYDGEKASVIVLYYLRKNLLPPLKKSIFKRKKGTKLDTCKCPIYILLASVYMLHHWVLLSQQE